MTFFRLFFLFISICCAVKIFAFQLPEQHTKSYECSDCSRLSHETIQHQWSVATTSLQPLKLNNVQKSFSYKKVVSAGELEAGVTLPTTAPGAVLRVTPIHHKVLPKLEIVTPNKHPINLKKASFLYSENNAMDTDLQQIMFELKPELGSGEFILHSKNTLTQTSTLKTNYSYTISVYEKASPFFLQVGTDSVHYQYGDTVTATISINAGSYESNDLNAYVIDSNEQKIPLALTKIHENTFQGSIKLASELNDRGKNWHIEVDTVGGLIKRSGHCAFSYAIPSASLLDIKKTSLKPLAFIATVNVATASRYALQTVLFQRNSQGEKVPVKTVQKAQWLEPGVHQIEVSFGDVNAIKEQDLYLGYLRLVDYGQLKTVHQFDKPIKLTQLGI